MRKATETAGQWQRIPIAGLPSHLSQLGFMAQRAVLFVMGPVPPFPTQKPPTQRTVFRPHLWSRLSLFVTVVGQAARAIRK